MTEFLVLLGAYVLVLVLLIYIGKWAEVPEHRHGEYIAACTMWPVLLFGGLLLLVIFGPLLAIDSFFKYLMRR